MDCFHLEKDFGHTYDRATGVQLIKNLGLKNSVKRLWKNW